MNPNSESLFHFTRKEAVFKSILKRGFRYSFAFERVPESVIDNILTRGLFKATEDISISTYRGIAMPMVSFCDIPLIRVERHSKNYGRFAIGVKKDFLCNFYSEFINPVLYGDSDTISKAITYISCAPGYLLKNLCSILCKESCPNSQSDEFDLSSSNVRQLISNNVECKDLFDYCIELSQSINNLISLYKPTYSKNSNGKILYNYDEREWRAIYPNIRDTEFQWQIGLYECEFFDIKDSLNKALDNSEDAFIVIPGHWFNQISHIVVPTEKIVERITNYIHHSKTLFGYSDISFDQRIHLISKITSFERIENDY